MFSFFIDFKNEERKRKANKKRRKNKHKLNKHNMKNHNGLEFSKAVWILGNNVKKLEENAIFPTWNFLPNQGIERDKLTPFKTVSKSRMRRT